MPKFWRSPAGKIIVSAAGKPIDCPDCPCDDARYVICGACSIPLMICATVVQKSITAFSTGMEGVYTLVYEPFGKPLAQSDIQCYFPGWFYVNYDTGMMMSLSCNGDSNFLFKIMNYYGLAGGDYNIFESLEAIPDPCNINGHSVDIYIYSGASLIDSYTVTFSSCACDYDSFYINTACNATAPAAMLVFGTDFDGYSVATNYRWTDSILSLAPYEDRWDFAIVQSGSSACPADLNIFCNAGAIYVPSLPADVWVFFDSGAPDGYIVADSYTASPFRLQFTTSWGATYVFTELGGCKHGGFTDVLTDCCPTDGIPTTLAMTQTMGNSVDLYYESGAWHNWHICNEIGTSTYLFIKLSCTSGTWALVFGPHSFSFCDSGYTWDEYTLTSSSCNPFELVFTGTSTGNVITIAP